MLVWERLAVASLAVIALMGALPNYICTLLGRSSKQTNKQTNKQKQMNVITMEIYFHGIPRYFLFNKQNNSQSLFKESEFNFKLTMVNIISNPMKKTKCHIFIQNGVGQAQNIQTKCKHDDLLIKPAFYKDCSQLYTKSSTDCAHPATLPGNL